MVVGQMCNQWRQREVYVLAVIWMQRQQALLGMVVDGAEGKGAIKQGTQVFILTTGKVVLPFIEPEIIGEGMDSGSGTIISCLDCQNSIRCLPSGIFPTIHTRKISFFIKTDPKEEKIFNRSKIKEIIFSLVLKQVQYLGGILSTYFGEDKFYI